MLKDIALQGYTTVPSDYECNDGALAASLNLLYEDGHIKPTPQPSTLCQLLDGWRALYVHTTSSFKHIIVQDSNNDVKWLDANNPDTSNPGAVYASNSIGAIHTISSVGNTLVAMSDTGMHYMLWKADNSNYSYLGQKPPFVRLEFSTTGNDYDFEFDNPDLPEGADYPGRAFYKTTLDSEAACPTHSEYSAITFDEDYRKDITDAAWALINKTNAKVAKEGRFYAPFFVRYAYRLFDGTSYILHSAPIFIPISLPSTYHVQILNYSTRDNQGVLEILRRTGGTACGIPLNKVVLAYKPMNVALTYRCDDDTNLNNLKSNWADIVKSVDIFVSLPMARENELETLASASPASWSCEVNNTGSQLGLPHLELRDYDWIAYSVLETFPANIILNLNTLSDEGYLEKIRSVYDFRLLHSFALEKLNSTMIDSSRSGFVDMPYNKDIVPLLSTRPTLPDDYKTHNTLLPTFSGDNCMSTLFTYNQRLNVAGIREKLFSGFGIKSLCSALGINASVSHPIYIQAIRVYLRTEDGIKIVQYNYDSDFTAQVFMLDNMPLFYPDNRAYRMVIKYASSPTTQTLSQYVDMPMEQCTMLNGAFTTGHLPTAFTSNPPFHYEGTSWPFISTNADIVPIQNKVYTSEVGNPFIFLATGINTVGTGTIFCLAAATKALSQGQFGQFPLYVFATDGVWALEVNPSSGLFSACHPVSRDIPLSNKAVTSIDTSVVFSTARGIMLVQGSNTVCLSDNVYADNNALIPGQAALLQLIDHANAASFFTDTFTGFLPNCQLMYDYAHQHLIAFNAETVTERGVTTPRYNYAYVYSFKSNAWGMITETLSYSLNAYPDAWAITEDNNIVSFSAPQLPDKGLLVTRPIKIENPDVLKSVHTAIVRGFFRKSNVQTVIYGSRDMFNWHVLLSSRNNELRNLRGTPYKFFRIAAVTTLDDHETIFSVSLQYDNRYMNTLH